jgi:Holliday junction resolvase
VRRAAKRDTSEKSIIAALKKRGCPVAQVSHPDFPDLLVGYNGDLYAMECKTGKAKLEPGQAKFMELFKGYKVFVVRTADEAIAALEVRDGAGVVADERR